MNKAKNEKVKVLLIILAAIVGFGILYYGMMFIGLMAYVSNDGKKSNREIISYMKKTYDIDLKLIEKEVVHDEHEIYYYRKKQDKDYKVEVEQVVSDTGVWELVYSAEDMLGDKLDKFRADIKNVMGERYDVKCSFDNLCIIAEYTYEDIPEVVEEMLKLPEYIKKHKSVYKMCEDILIRLQKEDFVDFEMGEFDEELIYTNMNITKERNHYVREKIKDKEMLVEILKYRYICSRTNNFSNLGILKEFPEKDVSKFLNDLDNYKEKYGEEEREED